MSEHVSRRRFGAVSLVAGVGVLAGEALLPGLRSLTAAQASLDPGVVQLRPEIEPLVRLIEDTPRQKLLEEIGARVNAGLDYQRLLAALFLAGVRNVQPRPSVGFKFHAVLVVNSAHLASMASPDSDRWLPIFWALDEFKASQARDVQEGNWTMPPVASAVPSAEKVRGEFHESMQKWDETRADVAAAGLARHLGATEVLELFARYAARDFRSIGHKAIFLANSWRTLQTIGWHHAEPVLRSLAYAMLNHEGEPNPADNDLSPDRPWRRNQELAKSIASGWLDGQANDDATTEFLSMLRNGSPEDAASLVVQQLNAGVSHQSIWDALHTGAGELLMRQAGIVALHAVTTTNAIRFLFDHTGDDQTRRLLLLQNAAFLPLFRQSMEGRGQVADSSVGNLQAADSVQDAHAALSQILADISGDRMRAANGVFSYLQHGNDASDLIDAARRLIFAKGDNAHDYKFSAAVLEDFYRISPSWRNQYLATSVYNLRGTGHRDNGLVERIRGALG